MSFCLKFLSKKSQVRNRWRKIFLLNVMAGIRRLNIWPKREPKNCKNRTFFRFRINKIIAYIYGCGAKITQKQE